MNNSNKTVQSQECSSKEDSLKSSESYTEYFIKKMHDNIKKEKEIAYENALQADPSLVRSNYDVPKHKDEPEQTSDELKYVYGVKDVFSVKMSGTNLEEYIKQDYFKKPENILDNLEKQCKCID